MSDKFEELYKISEEILDCYIDFLYSPLYSKSNFMHNKMVDMIKDLVFSEYEIIHSFSLEDIDEMLESLNNGDIIEFDQHVIVRVKNKLIDYRQILLGNSCDLYELNIDIDDDSDFSIYDVVLSMINIEIIKKIKKKVYSLVSSSEDELRFVGCLKQKLKLSKIQLFFSTSVSEMLALYYNTSIDDIPQIDIGCLKKVVSGFDDEVLKQAIENTMILCIKKTIDELSDDEYINLDPEGVFKHLIYITQLEILISYLNKDILKVIYEHLINIDEDKKLGINNVKRLMRSKINDN